MRALGGWIKKHREARGWSAGELARNLTVAGYPTKEGTIRVWEAPKGRPPKGETIAALERMFGAVAPGDSMPSDVAALVAAIDRLAASVDDQSDRLVDVLLRLAGPRDPVEALRIARGEPPMTPRHPGPARRPSAARTHGE